MHDLTQGSISKHIIRMAIPMAIGMVFQTLYYLVDLYFVGRLGDAAIAGVSAAGNIQFIVMALTQVLGVGTMVLISHAAGRKDQADGNLVFNQSLLLAALAALIVWVGGYFLADAYLRTLAADEETLKMGRDYLVWFLPALGLQFAIISIGSALRGTGIAKPTMIVQVATVLLNVILAPVLIAGWGTGKPMGVAGAALASTIAVVFAVIVLMAYFIKLEHFVSFDASLWKPHLATWKRLLRIGVPAGGEFALIFVSMGINYYIVRSFGAAAQAGFGVGSRMMQAIFLPAMAVAFAAAPIAGQNFAAGKFDRARETFFEAVKIGSVVMLCATLFAQLRPQWLVGIFAADPAVVEVASTFLRIISWNFVFAGIVFTCSGMFQAMGNTVPAVIASGIRLVIFAIPAFWISSRPGFQLHWLWYISMTASTLAGFVSVWLLHRESEKLRRRGVAGGPPSGIPTEPVAEPAAG